MASKSASNLKLAPKKRSMEETEELARKKFDAFKEVALNAIAVNIQMDDHFDLMVNIRDSYRNFFDRDQESITISEAAGYADEIKQLHVAIKEAIGDLTYEDMVADEFVNPIDALVNMERPRTWYEAFRLTILHSAAMPYAKQIIDTAEQLRKMIADAA